MFFSNNHCRFDYWRYDYCRFPDTPGVFRYQTTLGVLHRAQVCRLFGERSFRWMLDRLLSERRTRRSAVGHLQAGIIIHHILNSSLRLGCPMVADCGFALLLL